MENEKIIEEGTKDLVEEIVKQPVVSLKNLGIVGAGIVVIGLAAYGVKTIIKTKKAAAQVEGETETEAEDTNFTEVE